VKAAAPAAKRAACALALCGCLGAPLASLAASPQSIERRSAAQQAELADLRQRIEALQKKLAAAEEVKSETVDALRASERAISSANRRLFEIAERQQAASAELERLGAEVAETESAVALRQARLGKLLHQRYLAGEPDALRLALSGDHPAEASRLLGYYAYVARAIEREIGALRADRQRLEQASAAVRQRRAELDRLRAEAATERRRLDAERRERQVVLARVSRDIEERRKAIDTLRRDEQRLSRLVEQLARLLAARARPPARPPARPGAEPAPRERGEPRTAAREPAPLRAERVPEADLPAGSFEALRGRLALPVAGQVISRFGAPRADGGLHWRGLQIAARAGEVVRAIAPGRIVYADWLRGFGNLLIIDHGDGYMSLYGNNETLVRRVGDMVRGGDPIATVGSTGGSGEPGVYFELRHQGKPFDPLGWVTLR
jgi:septal ring factor EnvC (AmiA/AmiB activator)